MVGYASQANVTEARRAGVKRAVFSKRVGLSYHQMGVEEKDLRCTEALPRWR